MADERMVKCKWCSWTTPVWNSRGVNGLDALVTHCEDEHFGQVTELRRNLDLKNGVHTPSEEDCE